MVFVGVSNREIPVEMHGYAYTHTLSHTHIYTYTHIHIYRHKQKYIPASHVGVVEGDAVA